jgi:hypothetical protein
MFTAGVEAGGLIEARVHALRTPERARAYAEALGAVVARHAGKRLVLCADHRPVVIYSQPVADVLAALFSEMNTRLTRIAVLVAPTNATLTMQLERIVREAENPSRRVFLEAKGAEDFLGAVLDPRERLRLARFLA